MNEAAKGVVEGVSKITPTGLAAQAASGITGENIKSPLAAAASGTASGGNGMVSVEEVRAQIAMAVEKASEGMGTVQQAQSALEEAQAQLMQATEGSGQAAFDEANASLAQAVTNLADVQQSIQAARDSAETGAGQL